LAIPPKAPTLDDLLRENVRIGSLPTPSLIALTVAAAAVQEAIAGELLTRGAEAPPTAAVEPDVMLSVDEAAVIIHEEPRWFYRRRLPFIHRISRKKLLISRAGLMRWIATRKGL
jgi:hypothetical protein